VAIPWLAAAPFYRSLAVSDSLCRRIESWRSGVSFLAWMSQLTFDNIWKRVRPRNPFERAVFV